MNTLKAINALCEVGPRDRIFNVSPSGFDLSVYDLFGAWATGAAVVMAEDVEHPEPAQWAWAMRDSGVTIWDSTPALLEMLLDLVERDPASIACLEPLRIVMLSGDRISLPLLRRLIRLAPHVRVLAMGGATEASIWSLYNWVESLPPESRFVPYGRALHQQTIAVLDSHLREVPVGETGEFHIGGAGVARGYRNRPALTAERFIPDPRAMGARLYVTGDKVRRLADGNTEFIGRNDGQVKIRGFRVEISEVEHALLNLHEVEQAAVVCVDSVAGRSLVGCIVLGQHAASLRASTLRQLLALRLPAYMIPERLLRLDQLPVTANGKIDRARLCEIAALPVPTGEVLIDSQEDHSPTQEKVSAVWREVFALSQIPAGADFLDLGGNSLLAFQIVNRLSHEFDIDLSVREIFASPTISALSLLVDEMAGASARC